jgi:uncharacterized protein (UPF0548 family)
MISPKKPTADSIRRRLVAQATCEFTYSHVGATRSETITAQPPAGYTLDHTRIRLGAGRAVFAAATSALSDWRQFQLGWLEAVPSDTPIAVGVNVAVVARALGVWSVNCARIVYTIDGVLGGVHRFGFAYGTLPDHVESGEERFLIEWDTADDSVHYDILAFSRPRHLVARLGYPLIRRWQRRFGRESAAAMVRFVKANADIKPTA